MIWDEIKAAQKAVNNFEYEKASDETLTHILSEEGVLESALSIANQLREELRFADVGACVGILAAGGTWEDTELTPHDIATERKKMLYVMSGATTLSRPRHKQMKVARSFNKALGQLKDDPSDVTPAVKLEDILQAYPDSSAMFGDAFKPYDRSMKNNILHYTYSQLLELRTHTEPFQEDDYHKIRQSARRLAHAHILSICVRGEDSVSKEAMLLKQLHNSMGSHQYLTTQDGEELVAPTSEQRQKAKTILDIRRMNLRNTDLKA